MKFLLKFIYLPTRKFQKRHQDCIICACCIKISISILQVAGINFKKERIPVCAKMANFGLISIKILLFLGLIVFLVVSEAINNGFRLNVPIKIRVSYSNFMRLIRPIE